MAMTQYENNVMIVEDDKHNQKLLSTIVSQLQCETFVHSNGMRAINDPRLEHMDLILLDINMPEMNGFEFCREIKKRENTKDIPVIFISALSGTKDVLNAFEAGGVDYIPKPYQIEEVKARVSVQLLLKQKSQRLEKTIDRLIATQNELYKSKKLASLGVLTAGIAHEVNNPVNFIYTGVNNLKEDYCELQPLLALISSSAKNGKQLLTAIYKLQKEIDLKEILSSIEQTIEDIKYGAERTRDIIKGLMTFSRQDEAEKQATDIHGCINSTLLLLRNKIKSNITVTKEYDPEIQQIMAYPGEISQVFMNIINNAIDAFENVEKDNLNEIFIKTFVFKKYIKVQIMDNGPGISEDIIENIFDPFFTTKKTGQGTGLGLSISYGIIKKHQGKIEVKSKIGQGTQFTVLLPVD